MKKFLFLLLFLTDFVQAQTEITIKGGKDSSHYLSEYFNSPYFKDIVDSSTSVRIVIYNGNENDVYTQNTEPLIVIFIENDFIVPKDDTVINENLWEEPMILTMDGRFDSIEEFENHPSPKRPLISFSSIEEVKIVDCHSRQTTGIEGGGFIPEDSTLESSEEDEYSLEDDSFEEFCK